MVLFFDIGGGFMKILDDDKRLLDQILNISVETYNCYKNMAMLDDFGLKGSPKYIEKVDKINSNHKIEDSLFKLLNIRDLEYFKACCDYVFNKCDEYEIDKIINARVWSRLKNELSLVNFNNFVSLKDTNQEQIQKRAVNCFRDVIVSLSFIDFEFIFVNELKNQLRKKFCNMVYNAVLYDFIFSWSNVEAEFLQNGFNFDSDKYLCSRLRTETVFRVKSGFDEKINFYDVYNPTILGVADGFLWNSIRRYKSDKLDINRACLISSLISIFTMLEVNNLEDFISNFNQYSSKFGNLEESTNEYGGILEEAFNEYKNRRGNYKRLSFKYK